MNRDLIEKVVHAVLYEGYILYPYRASAKKNRERFTFGRVYPEAYSCAQKGAEPFVMQTQCLVRCDPAVLKIQVRFLHPMTREVGIRNSKDVLEVVPELRVDGRIYHTWQEAVEREITISAGSLLSGSGSFPFTFPASRTTESINDKSGRETGVIARRQEALAGLIETAVEPVDEEVIQITVRIINQTPMPPESLNDQGAVLLRTFASTHTILSAEQGEFLSLIDPPQPYAAAAAACQNVGTWPILVGELEKNERDAMISSPIIMYDFPQIAPESPGDLFDGAEIDEILTLRILTMTDEEKREMRNVDEHARRILERTETMPEDYLLKMHGVMHPESPFDEEFFNPKDRLETVSRSGVELHKGSRVRIHPKGRADIFDIALAGKTALVEALERDAENNIHLALVLEDDPGKDLGFMRQPGHRFFYTLDEVEPLGKDDK
jgi:hypothetical protein